MARLGCTVLVTLLLAAAPAAAAPPCKTVRLPAAGGTVAGTLCAPPSADTAQLLIHGGTYGRSYWDWPLQTSRYSYVRRATGARFATLAVDRLGVGDSVRLASSSVDFAANSEVLHRWVQALRTGAFGRAFETVVAVGHSFGSAYALDEFVRYRDTDALVLTGFLHNSGAGVVDVTQALYPAALDARFAGQGRDLGWQTTRPGERDVFYWTPGADPAVIASDEAAKEALSGSEFPGLFDQIFAPAPLNGAQTVDVPVLLAVGEHDSLFCGLPLSCASEAELRAHEREFFTAAPRVDVATFAEQGHDLNLHRAAPAFFAEAQDWIAAVTP